MLFLDAVEQLNEEELRHFLATAHAASFAILTKGQTGKLIVKAGSGLAKIWPSKESPIPDKLRETGGEWGKALEIAFAKELENRQHHTLYQLRHEFLKTLVELARLPEATVEDPKALARGVLKACAEHYEISVEFTPEREVETEVARAFLDSTLQSLRKAMSEQSLDEDAISTEMDKHLKAMAQGDRDAIIEALGIEQVNGRVLLDAIKRGTLTMGALSAVGATGFGAFMALSAMLQAIGLLMGITIPFAVYTSASSSLGLALGPVGVIGIPLLVMGFYSLKGKGKHDRALLASMMAALHSKLQQTAAQRRRNTEEESAA